MNDRRQPFTPGHSRARTCDTLPVRLAPAVDRQLPPGLSYLSHPLRQRHPPTHAPVSRTRNHRTSSHAHGTLLSCVARPAASAVGGIPTGSQDTYSNSKLPPGGAVRLRPARTCDTLPVWLGLWPQLTSDRLRSGGWGSLRPAAVAQGPCDDPAAGTALPWSLGSQDAAEAGAYGCVSA